MFFTGINRNIVECKYDLIKHIQTIIYELIETLWNVNMEVRFPNGSRIMN